MDEYINISNELIKIQTEVINSKDKIIKTKDELLKTQKELIKTNQNVFRIVKLYLGDFIENNDLNENDKSELINICDILNKEIKL